MYDWPEVRPATAKLEKALGKALAGRLGLAPERLKPWPVGMDLGEAWTRSDLLLTQTCGYPLTHGLRGKVRLVGAPHYSAPDCEGVSYRSRIVVRKDSRFRNLEDLRGSRAVFNSLDSQSGMNAFRHAIAPFAGGKPFFGRVMATGSHRASASAVVAGDADVACIDCVCWQLICNEVPGLADHLDAIAATAAVPGLPLITSLRFSVADEAAIAETVEEVFSAPETRKSRERLGIRGFSRLFFEDYAAIPAMEDEAVSQGYPDLL
ncbi:PhnD/SsuA/transferrin family substrate-binding protein [Labrenzia aggregata]|uniref:PhnD/SsuA/transferrin family substrate-binding protein n=2 Tax=Roseibium aggregatum TaxID=187304 RepID=A0A939EF95_9HYPH|nr:PhnD/SsuA/transferrin family substrate-binding protein [Roseibium aggregatum]